MLERAPREERPRDHGDDERHEHRRGDPDEQAGAKAHGHELVPRAAHGADQLGAVELAAELADVHVDRARPAGEREPPDPLEDALAPDDDARPLGEVPDQVELACRELDRRAVDRGRPRATVEHHVAGVEDVVLGLGLRAAQHRMDARDELARRERLRHVVVRAQLEARDAVDLLVARGEHHDRQPRAGADRAAHVEAVGVGQLQIEDREPDVVPLELGEPLGAARRPDDAKAVALEVRADDRGDVLLVLDHEDRPAARHVRHRPPRGRARRAPRRSACGRSAPASRGGACEARPSPSRARPASPA